MQNVYSSSLVKNTNRSFPPATKPILQIIACPQRLGRVEKQTKVYWTENYTQMLTSTPPNFPWAYAYSISKIKWTWGRKECFPFLPSQGRSCQFGAMLVYFAILRVGSLEVWLWLTLKGSIEEKQDAYTAPQINDV